MAWRIETARMVVRPFARGDLDDLAGLCGDAAVMRYIGDGRPVAREVVERETLPGILAEYGRLPEGLGWFAGAEKATGAFVGCFALRPAESVGLDGGTELGYRLRRGAWGRGLATEGARALVREAFGELGADRVVATTMVVNTASRRVLEKTGLRQARVFFAEWPAYIEGAEHGDVVYELAKGV